MSQRLRFTRVIGHGLAVCLLSLSVATARGDQASSPRCALIDSSTSPVATLVEAELLAQPDTTWLERTEIDRVMAEQELSALLGATALQGRVALGQALKADILVMLETKQENQQQLVRVVVAEANGGLRLLSTKIPLTDDGASDAERIVKRVQEAMERHGEEITEVFTVPPFYSRDLTYDFDDLKRTYATLVQQRLLAQPGVLVVELEEADAIAREYALASPGDGPTRRLPLYLLGEYRNDGMGDQRQVAITMRLKRGDKILRTTEETVSPDAAADLLMQAAGELAGWEEDREIGGSSRIEARQLAERGAEFLLLGDWDEALALSQASLLMRPNQPAVHAQVCEAARELSDVCLTVDNHVDNAAKEIAYRRLTLRHLEAIAGSNPDLEAFAVLVNKTLPRQRYRGRHWGYSAPPEGLGKANAELAAAERAFLQQMAHRYARAKSWYNCGRFLSKSAEDLAPIDRYSLRLRFILEYQHQAKPATLIRDLGHTGYSGFFNSFEARAFLEDLVASREAGADLRETARATLQRFDKTRESLAQRARDSIPDRTRPKAARPAHGFRLRPLQVTWRHADGRTGKLEYFQGCLQLPNGTDLLWNRYRGIYLMKQAGHATLIWPDYVMYNNPIRSVVFDGKYVWFSVYFHRQAPQVWVFDPVSEKRWQITADHGLPLIVPDASKSNGRMYSDATVAAIAPGKAMVSGSFGRAWLATVDFDPAGNHRVHVFHEARKIQDRTDPNQRRDPEVAYWTSYIIRLTGDGGETNQRDERVIVGRNAPGFGGYPLIVDPHTLAVTAREEYWHKSGTSDYWRGALYFTSVLPEQPSTICLLRSAAPDLTPQPLIRGVKEGIVIMQDDAVNVVGKQWWRGTLADGKLECLGDVPWYFGCQLGASGPPEQVRLQPDDLRLEGITRSNHYGVLASYRAHDNQVGSTIAQVLFDAPAAASQSAAAAGESNREDPADSTAALPAADLAWGSHANVKVAAVTRDRQHFATADDRGQILVWSVAELRPIRELPRQKRGLYDLDFSPDGRLLAAAGQDRTVRIWDWREGDERLLVGIPNSGADRVLFAPDGRHFVTDSIGTIWWDIATGQPIKIESMPEFAGFLPDGTLLGSSAGLPRRLIAWNPADQSYRQVWERCWGWPMWLSPDGKRLCTRERIRCVDGRFIESPRTRLWDLQSEQEIAHTDNFRSLTLDRTELADRVNVTTYVGTEQRWRFAPVTPWK